MEGIAETLLKHNASWHKSCRVKYNATKLKRLERKRNQLKEKYHCNSMIVESAQDLTSLVRL